jgi:hypothetical protein
LTPHKKIGFVYNELDSTANFSEPQNLSDLIPFLEQEGQTPFLSWLLQQRSIESEHQPQLPAWRLSFESNEFA